MEAGETYMSVLKISKVWLWQTWFFQHILFRFGGFPRPPYSQIFQIPGLLFSQKQRTKSFWLSHSGDMFPSGSPGARAACAMSAFDTFADAQDLVALAPLVVDGNEIKPVTIIPEISRSQKK